MSSTASVPPGRRPGGDALHAKMHAADQRVCEVAGVLHGGYGALVDLVAEALDEGLWEQAGIHTPAHWLAWKSGLSIRRARHVVLIAGRRSELPCAVAALVAGELSIDQVRVIAAHVPAPFDHAATDIARLMTVSQLERTLPDYCFDEPTPAASGTAADPTGPAAAEGGGDGEGGRDGEGNGVEGGASNLADDPTTADSTGEPDSPDGNGGSDTNDAPAGASGGAFDRSGAPGDAGVGGEPSLGGFGGFGPGPESKRRASWSFDDSGMGRLSACLPTDEALVFQAAWHAARTDLLTQARRDQPDGTRVPWISGAEVLLHLARSYLDHGRTTRPGADRYLVHTHLDHHADGTPVLRSHLGPVLPDTLRRYLTCDADTRPVWERHGTALSVGRRERIVSDRTRRIIEHRDHGCVIPGCNRRHNLDIHHITHWEHGGRTDTDNLCCLCRTHHRQHHLGIIGITGNADVAGGLTITDRWGQPLQPTGTPHPVDPTQPLHGAAADRHIPTPTYQGGTGERFNPHWLDLQPTPPKPPEPPGPGPEPPNPDPPQGTDPPDRPDPPDGLDPPDAASTPHT